VPRFVRGRIDAGRVGAAGRTDPAEVAAIFALLEAMDDPSKRQLPRAEPEPYRPAKSTVDAFHLLIQAGDAARARAWLADRPKDAPYLLALLEG
jgi:hypothetical protein